MGANGLSAVRLSRVSAGSSDIQSGLGENIGSNSSKHRWHFFVGSGGDDQSLAVCWGEVIVDCKVPV